MNSRDKKYQYPTSVYHVWNRCRVLFLSLFSAIFLHYVKLLCFSISTLFLCFLQLHPMKKTHPSFIHFLYTSGAEFGKDWQYSKQLQWGSLPQLFQQYKVSSLSSLPHCFLLRLITIFSTIVKQMTRADGLNLFNDKLQ